MKDLELYWLSDHKETILNDDIKKTGYDPEIIKEIESHLEEIKLALEKHKRVYLLVSPMYNFSGVFHSPDTKKLYDIVNGNKDGLKQNNQVCLLMSYGEEDYTNAEVMKIFYDDHDSVPKLALMSFGNVLLNAEGIGLDFAGKK